MDESLESEETKCRVIIKEELELEECEFSAPLNGENYSGAIELRVKSEEEIHSRNGRKTKLSRYMKDMCEDRYANNSCNLICGKKLISIKQKELIFQYFWSLPNRMQQYKYIARHVRLVIPNKRKTSHNQICYNYSKVRRCKRLYLLPIDGKLGIVCVRAFIATLEINSNWIFMSIKKFGHLSFVKLFDSEVPPPLILIRPISNLPLRSAEENNAQEKSVFCFNNVQIPSLVPISPVTNPKLISTDENNIKLETKFLDVNQDSVDNAENDLKAKKKKELKRKHAIEARRPYAKYGGAKYIGRRVREGCSSDCLLNCHTVTEEQRQNIFRDFWSINDRFGKYEFISRLVGQNGSKNKIVGRSRRTRRQYFFEIDGQFKRVCRLMFLATLDISLFWVFSAVIHLGPRAVVSVNDVEDKDIGPIL